MWRFGVIRRETNTPLLIPTNVGSEIAQSLYWLGSILTCVSPDRTCLSPHLGFCSLLYSQFTTIVSASWADSVIDVMSATVWAKCQCRHFCFVVGTTFRLSGVRLSSFWMCHNSLLFYLVFFNSCIRVSILLFSHAERLLSILFTLDISFFIIQRGAEVVLEKCIHLRIATTILVTMHQREIHYDQFVC